MNPGDVRTATRAPDVTGPHFPETENPTMTMTTPTPAELAQAVARLRAAHAVADAGLDDELADRQLIAETLMSEITASLRVFTAALGQRP